MEACRRVAARKPVQTRDGREGGEPRDVLVGAAEHSVDHGCVGGGVFLLVLARRADEQLSGDAGLNVECNGVGGGGVARS